ncbi:MAG: Ig-like domain-containing protein [Bacteroidota bacterium]|jgi:uncharacterized protein (DUF2141 family)
MISKISRTIFFLRFTIFILIAAVFSQCAQMLPLTGGEKDTNPPKVLSQNPANSQLNFSGDKIQIEFDEYIQLKDIQNQLIISPQLAYNPETEIKGKTLLLKFKEPLNPSTTYQINFGNSVADIHEGNILSDYSVVFSTGNYLDSISLSGNIIDAFTKKTRSDISVFLYKNGIDSSCFKYKPDFFARADKNGNYNFRYLSPGLYKVVAFSDKNKNFVYEQGEEDVDEWIDNYNDKINLIKNETHDFSVYKDFGQKFFLRKVWYDEYGKVRYCFNRPIVNPNLIFPYKQDFRWRFSKNNDTLHLFFNAEIKDTTFFLLKDGVNLLDTLKLIKPSQEKKSADERKGLLKPKFSAVFEQINDSAIYILFSGPLKKMNFKNMILQSSGEKMSIIKIDSVRPDMIKVYLQQRISEGELLLLPETVENFIGVKNDTCKFKFSLRSLSSCGSLNLKLEFKKGIKYVLQIMNQSDNVIYESKNSFYNSNTFLNKIDFIPSGNYKLRLIEDEDEDGKWSTGSFLKRKKPEKVFYYDKPLEVISEWETNVDWKIEN